MEEAKGAATKLMGGQVDVSCWELLSMGRWLAWGLARCGNDNNNNDNNGVFLPYLHTTSSLGSEWR